MTAVPHLAGALSNASGRFERASFSLLKAASGADSEDMGAALAGMTAAKIQFKASLAVIRFSDDMWDALLDMKRGGR